MSSESSKINQSETASQPAKAESHLALIREGAITATDLMLGGWITKTLDQSRASRPPQRTLEVPTYTATQPTREISIGQAIQHAGTPNLVTIGISAFLAWITAWNPFILGQLFAPLTAKVLSHMGLGEEAIMWVGAGIFALGIAGLVAAVPALAFASLLAVGLGIGVVFQPFIVRLFAR